MQLSFEHPYHPLLRGRMAAPAGHGTAGPVAHAGASSSVQFTVVGCVGSHGIICSRRYVVHDVCFAAHVEPNGHQPACAAPAVEAALLGRQCAPCWEHVLPAPFDQEGNSTLGFTGPFSTGMDAWCL